MFEDSLFDSSKKFKRSPWGTALSFLVQVLLIGVLVMIPIIYPEALPKQQFMTFLVAPPPPPPPPAGASLAKVQKKVVTELDNGQLRTPTAIPKKVAKIQEEDAPAQRDQDCNPDHQLPDRRRHTQYFQSVVSQVTHG